MDNLVQPEIKIELNPPHRYEPPLRLNEFGIPDKPFYRSADVAKVLGITVSALVWRFCHSWYTEVEKDSAGRWIFNLEDIRAMQAIEP